MAIGSHGRGRGGTVGDGRLGRRPTVEKLFSFMRRFGAAAVTIDLKLGLVFFRVGPGPP